MALKFIQHVTCLLTVLVFVAGSHAEDIQAKLTHAKNLTSASRWDEAIEAYNGIIDQLEGEQNAKARYALGMCKLRKYKSTDAIPEFQKVVDHPHATAKLKGNAQYNIGLSNAYNLKYEDALAAYAKVHEIKDVEPTISSVAYVFAGHSLNKLKRYDEAIESYLKGAEIEEAHFVTRQTAYLAAASIHQRLERYEKAVPIFRKVLKLGKNHHYGHIAANRIIECETAISGSDAFYINPYVPSVSADSVKIFWISRESAPAGEVKVWADETTPIKVTAKKVPIKGRKEFRQSAIVSGLKPGIRYRYSASCNNESHEGTFLTAPIDGRPVRFAVLGDTQGGHARHARVATAIAKDKPDFVIHVGDCVERGDRWDEWKVQVFDPGYAYLQDSPVFVARGNHDGGAFFHIFFGREKNLFEDYRFGDVHVFAMDSHSSTGGARKTAQLKWLEEGLSQSDAKWKIVALHHPMIHVAYPIRPFGQKEFLPILEEHGVDVILTGHYHVYQRLIPIGKPGKKPIMHITSGGGGGNMGSRTPSPLVVKDYMDIHHLLFDCDGGKLEMVARTPNGEQIDTMTLIHTSEGFQTEVMGKFIDTETAKAARLTYVNLSHPNQRKHEWLLTPKTTIEAGKPVAFELQHTMIDTTALPANSTLVIQSTEDSAWKIEEQTLGLSGNQFEFTAIAPEKVKVEKSHVSPSLSATVRMRIGDRDLEPETIKLSIVR